MHATIVHESVLIQTPMTEKMIMKDLDLDLHLQKKQDPVTNTKVHTILK